MRDDCFSEADVVKEPGFPAALDAARAGSEWAWTAIYRDLSPMVFRYLRAHHAPDAEDLMGDVFVQVVRRLSSFSGGERDFRAWVMTIVRNRLIDEWRRVSKHAISFTPDDPRQAEADWGDPEDEAMRRFSCSQVRVILDRLSVDQRDVLFLRVFAGLSVEETGRVVAKTPGAVKALQSRALAAIQRALSREAVTLPGSVTLSGAR
jgi:RNA polymerase sigma factor (sigma-70 family)